MCTYECIRFEWDSEKNRINQRKHGIDFEDAKRLFEQPILEMDVERHNEIRTVAFGHLHGVPVVVVYTLRSENTYRLISARRASPREERMAMIKLREPRRKQHKSKSQSKTDHHDD